MNHGEYLRLSQMGFLQTGGDGDEKKLLVDATIQGGALNQREQENGAQQTVNSCMNDLKRQAMRELFASPQVPENFSRPPPRDCAGKNISPERCIERARSS